MLIDVDRLREAVKQECLGVFYGGGFGAALMESFDADSASSEKLVEMAQKLGIDLYRFEVEEDE